MSLHIIEQAERMSEYKTSEGVNASVQDTKMSNLAQNG